MGQEEHEGTRDGKMKAASQRTNRGGKGVEQGPPEEEGGETGGESELPQQASIEMKREGGEEMVNLL